jgi:hypothetical protein
VVDHSSNRHSYTIQVRPIEHLPVCPAVSFCSIRASTR